MLTPNVIGYKKLGLVLGLDKDLKPKDWIRLPQARKNQIIGAGLAGFTGFAPTSLKKPFNTYATVTKENRNP